MALHPDISDPALLDAFEDVRNENTPTNWAIFGYVPRTDKIKVENTGTGDLKEMMDYVSEGKVHYCFIRYKINEVYKFVYIAWCGEGVAGMRRGSFTNHSVDMGKLLHGFHVQINARVEKDVNEQDILARLAKATASHGRTSNKSKFQGTASENATPGSVAGARSAVTTERSFTPQRAGLIDTEQSKAFWDQQKLKDEQTKQENAYVPQRQAYGQGGTGSAAGLRDKFSQPPAPYEKPAAPPPARGAPAPAPVRAPEPEPEPEPEQSWEAPEEQAPPPEAEPEQSWEAPPEEAAPPADEGGYDEGGYDQGGYDQGGYDQGGEAPPSGTGIMCRALYDYEGENEGDLPFKENDTIEVLDQSDPSGWWQGTVNGVTGFFPSNFVELIQ